MLLPFYFKEEKQWGYIYEDGTPSSLPFFENAGEFSEGLAVVRKNDLCGYINENGDLCIDYKFEDAENFCDGLAAVYYNDGYGIIDKTGKFVVDPVFSSLALPNEGLCPASLSPVFDVEPNLVNRLSLLPENEDAADHNDRYGFVDMESKVVIPFYYSDASGFDENGWCRVERDGAVYFIDRKGNSIFKNDEYDDVDCFYEDIAVVGKSGKYGYISRDGKEIIPCEYDDAAPCGEGLLPVVCDGKWRYLDLKGNLAFVSYFDNATPFSKGVALVCRDDKWGLIDKTGKFILEPKYEEITSAGEDTGFFRLWLDEETMIYYNIAEGKFLTAQKCLCSRKVREV